MWSAGSVAPHLRGPEAGAVSDPGGSPPADRRRVRRSSEARDGGTARRDPVTLVDYNRVATALSRNGRHAATAGPPSSSTQLTAGKLRRFGVVPIGRAERENSGPHNGPRVDRSHGHSAARPGSIVCHPIGVAPISPGNALCPERHRPLGPLDRPRWTRLADCHGITVLDPRRAGISPAHDPLPPCDGGAAMEIHRRAECRGSRPTSVDGRRLLPARPSGPAGPPTASSAGRSLLNRSVKAARRRCTTGPLVRWRAPLQATGVPPGRGCPDGSSMRVTRSVIARRWARVRSSVRSWV